MLLQGDCPGEKIVVLGGGLVGCEAALHLENLGKKVTIVEKLDDILQTVKHATNNDQALRHLLSESNITIHTGALLSAIDTGKVTIEKDGQKTDLPCDTLIIAIGYHADKSLAQSLKGKIDKVFTIGDNLRPAKVIDAVHEGFHTARLLEELTT